MQYFYYFLNFFLQFPKSVAISSFHISSFGVSNIKGMFWTSFLFTICMNASFPINPSPILSCLSLLEERGTLESFRCIPYSLSAPKIEKNESRTLSGSALISYPAPNRCAVSRVKPTLSEACIFERIFSSSSKLEP